MRIAGYGQYKDEWYEDVGLIANAHVFSGIGADSVSYVEKGAGHFGSVRRVVATSDSVQFIGDSEYQPDRITDKVLHLHDEREEAYHSFDKEKISARIARLEGGVCSINVSV